VGYTLLHSATRKNHTEVVKFLLTITELDVGAENVYGETALHVACHEGNLELAQLLEGAGISYKHQSAPEDSTVGAAASLDTGGVSDLLTRLLVSVVPVVASLRCFALPQETVGAGREHLEALQERLKIAKKPARLNVSSDLKPY
jgi:ankyrin repeat protein